MEQENKPVKYIFIAFCILAVLIILNGVFKVVVYESKPKELTELDRLILERKAYLSSDDYKIPALENHNKRIIAEMKRRGMEIPEEFKNKYTDDKE